MLSLLFDIGFQLFARILQLYCFHAADDWVLLCFQWFVFHCGALFQYFHQRLFFEFLSELCAILLLSFLLGLCHSIVVLSLLLDIVIVIM